MQSNLVNMDTEGAIRGVHINRVSVLIEFRKNDSKRFLYPGTKQTAGVRKAAFDCTIIM